MVWIFYTVGIVFCIIAIFIYYRNVFEDEKKISYSVVLMILGVILIAVATAKDLRLIQ